MKTNSPTRFRPDSWSVPLACDLMPYLDKPRLRRALGGATVAGGLLLGAAHAKAQEPPVTFALRGIDGLQRISLWNLAVDYESHPPPQFVDVDGDGDLDLLYWAAGMTPPHSSLLVWENTGTPYSPRFQRPKTIEKHPAQGMAFDTAFADFDGDGDNDKALLDSSMYFENVGTMEDPDFVERTGGGNPLSGLPFVPIAAVDLDGDGFADLIDPDLGLHLNVPRNGARGFAVETQRPFGDLHPCEQFDIVVFADLDGDGDFDALVFEKASELSRQYYVENIGDFRTPILVNRGGLPADFESGVFGGLPGSGLDYTVFADVDGDGDFDARLALWSVGVAELSYRNTGTPAEPVFVEDSTLVNASFPQPSTRAYVDIDGDGDLDRFESIEDGEIVFSRRTDDGLQVVSGSANPLDGFRFAGYSSLAFVDIDGDQDLDLFVSDENHGLFFFENVAHPSSATDADGDGLPDAWEIRHFGDTTSSNAEGDPDNDGLTNAEELEHYTIPTVADTDGDGFLDGTELALGTLPLIRGTDPPVCAFATTPASALSIHEVMPATVRLQAVLPVEAPVALWHSPDLANWTPLGDPFVGLGMRQELLAERAFGDPQGFYRIRSVQPPIEPPELEPGPPEAFTWVPKTLGFENAVLNGLVRPNLAPTLGYFEWGRDPQALVNRTPAEPVTDGSVPEVIQATFPSLTPGWPYFYRVVASNAFGVARSSVDSFGVVELRSPSAGYGVWGWGESWSSGAIPPRGLTNAVAIAAGSYHSLALTGRGTVVGWGSNQEGQARIPPGLSNVVAIAAGYGHSLALTSEGQVVGWGNNSSGGARPPSALSNVVAIAAGGGHSLALRADGTVVGWGSGGSQTTIPPGLSNVVAIAAGGEHSLALRADGMVVGWGSNWSGQASPPPGLSNVVAIAAGRQQSLALRIDGTLAAWGRRELGSVITIPEGLENVVATAGGPSESLAILTDGSVVVWGDIYAAGDIYRQAMVRGLSNVVAVAAGGDHNLALSGQPPGMAAPQLVGSRPLIATVGCAFHHRLMAMNGVDAYGANGLPTGLVLDPDTGLITGQPTEAGTYSVVVSAANELGADTREVTLFVNGP